MSFNSSRVLLGKMPEAHKVEGYHLLDYRFKEFNLKFSGKYIQSALEPWEECGPYVALWQSNSAFLGNPPQTYLVISYASGKPDAEITELFRSEGHAGASNDAAHFLYSLKEEYPYASKDDDPALPRNQEKKHGGYRPGAGKPRRPGEYRQVEVRTDLINLAQQCAETSNAREAIEIVLSSVLQS